MSNMSEKITYIDFNNLIEKYKDDFEYEFIDNVIDILKKLGVNIKIVALLVNNFSNKEDALKIVYISDDNDKKLIEIADRFYYLITDEYYFVVGDDEEGYEDEIYDDSAVEDILKEYGDLIKNIIVIEARYKGKLFIFV